MNSSWRHAASTRRRALAAGVALVHLCLLLSAVWHRCDEHEHEHRHLAGSDAPQSVELHLDSIAEPSDSCELCALHRSSWDRPTVEPALPSLGLETCGLRGISPPSAAFSPTGLGPRGPPALSLAAA